MLDLLLSLTAIAAAVSFCGAVAVSIWPVSPELHLWLFAVTSLGHAIHTRDPARCPPRVRSFAGFLWAPAGRVRRLAAGTPVLAGKRYYLYASCVPSTMILWVGWWNCRVCEIAGTREECVILRRGSTTYAVPTRGYLGPPLSAQPLP